MEYQQQQQKNGGKYTKSTFQKKLKNSEETKM